MSIIPNCNGGYAHCDYHSELYMAIWIRKQCSYNICIPVLMIVERYLYGGLGSDCAIVGQFLCNSVD